jgi:hypothetical protein
VEPHELIWTLTNAGVAARCLHVVAALGVADHIDDAPVSAKELAAACAADPDALDRVLRLLAAHGVFDVVGGAYRHTEASRLLRTDHPRSMRAFPEMMGLPVMTRCFADLGHAVRTGRPSLELTAPDGLWAHLDREPDQRSVFGRAMTAKAAGDTAAVLDAWDFSTRRRVVDVGGGRGHLLHAVLEAAPNAQGILFDLPDVVEAGGPAHPRLIRQPGDFFVDPLPAGDTYLLMEVIHDWSDAEAVAILTAIRRSAPSDAAVLIIENILPELSLDARSQALDIIMLAVTGGRERTAEQLGALLDAAGLRLTGVSETAGPLRIAMAHPAPSDGRSRRLAAARDDS